MVNTIEFLTPASGNRISKREGGARRLTLLQGLTYIIRSINDVPNMRSTNKKADTAVRSSGSEERIKEER